MKKLANIAEFLNSRQFHLFMNENLFDHMSMVICNIFLKKTTLGPYIGIKISVYVTVIIGGGGR